LPEVGLRFNVVLIVAFFKVFLHNGENPLNCSAPSSALVGSELTSEAVQEVGTHTKIIAAPVLRCPNRDALFERGRFVCFGAKSEQSN
jgi:hypothetical protein